MGRLRNFLLIKNSKDDVLRVGEEVEKKNFKEFEIFRLDFNMMKWFAL